MDFSNKKFDVVILAGQSNAEGNGVMPGILPKQVDNVYQATDKNPAYITEGIKNSPKLILTLPVEYEIQNYQERTDGKNSYADMAKSFALSYISSGMLKKGRDILIIKSGVGGTGFSRNEWGIASLLYERLKQMTDAVLSINPSNRIVAFLWHQGEHDAYENAEFTEKERYDFYHDRFKEQILDFLKRYSRFKFPVIAGEIIKDWAADYRSQCDAVEKATEDVIKEIGFGGIAVSDGLISNNQAVFNGDNIHFSAESIRELGRRYFTIYKELVK